jgi:hypothetical protein
VAKRRRAEPRRARSSAGAALTGLRAYERDLLEQRSRIDQQLQAVQQAIAAMGAQPGAASAGPSRPAGRRAAGGGPRPGSLKDHILQVLGAGQVMSVKDITDGVLSAGYSTRNKTLAKSVGIALAEMPQVRKVARGKFRTK